MIQGISLFALPAHDGAYESWPLKTELLKRGAPTGKFVPGFVIEAQYEWDDHYLIVTSWDCPFEEAQEFLLLSANLDILAKKHLGAMYATVWIDKHEAVADNQVLFHCNGSLEVLITLQRRRFFSHRPSLKMDISECA